MSTSYAQYTIVLVKRFSFRSSEQALILKILACLLSVPQQASRSVLLFNFEIHSFGNLLDNRIENLVLTSASEHATEHQGILKAARAEIKRLQSIIASLTKAP